MNIKQKNEVEIDDSNLKDFLEQDLEGLKFILNEVEDFTSDLTPIQISKLVPKPVYGFLNYYKEIKDHTRKKLTKI